MLPFASLAPPALVLLLSIHAGPAALHDPDLVKPPAKERGIPELLREISIDTGRGMNPYLGSAQLDQLRESLTRLHLGDDLNARWPVLLKIGDNELRLGQIDRAIATLKQALDLASQTEVPRRYVNQLHFSLGVASLRNGELANCCRQFTPESCILPIRGDGLHKDKSGSRAALEQFETVLKNSGKRSHAGLRSRWLANIAAMTLGTYPDGVSEEFRIDPRAFESDEDFPHFPQHGSQLGIGAVDLAGGLAIEDFDGDGWLDVVTSTSDTTGSMKLFLNDGEGGFVEKPGALKDQLGGLNLVQADYDNDGDTDLFVLRGAWWSKWGEHPNSLLRNEGDGVFVDVTRSAGLAEPFLPTQTAAWADYDNDGDLDLYIGNESMDGAVASQLFRNEGDGSFADVTEAAGVENFRYAKGVVWGDFDGDRFPDLYVSNMAAKNRLYRNLGDGTFVDIAKKAGVHLPISGFPCWFFDYDNDGRLDLFASAYGGPETSPDIADVAASFLGIPHRGELDKLYRNTSRGFVAAERGLGLDRYTLPMGANFGDLDNDGWLDFYLGTGFPAIEALMPNVMYRNLAGRGFADITTAGGFGHLQKGHAIAFADFDHDGDQDVFEQMGGAFPGDGFSNALYVNPGQNNHWVKLRAVGVESNRSAIGVRVHAVLFEGEDERHIYRTVGSGGSFGANPFLVELGLGSAESIERLEVYWPTTDRTQVFEGVGVDQRYRLVEGKDELVKF